MTSEALITVQIFFQLLLGAKQNWVTLSYHDEQEKPFKLTVGMIFLILGYLGCAIMSECHKYLKFRLVVTVLVMFFLRVPY